MAHLDLWKINGTVTVYSWDKHCKLYPYESQPVHYEPDNSVYGSGYQERYGLMAKTKFRPVRSECFSGYNLYPDQSPVVIEIDYLSADRIKDIDETGMIYIDVRDYVIYYHGGSDFGIVYICPYINFVELLTQAPTWPLIQLPKIILNSGMPLFGVAGHNHNNMQKLLPQIKKYNNTDKCKDACKSTDTDTTDVSTLLRFNDAGLLQWVKNKVSSIIN